MTEPFTPDVRDSGERSVLRELATDDAAGQPNVTPAVSPERPDGLEAELRCVEDAS